jgi:uncharacterized protein YfiM (DUF2279 family)
MLLLFVVFPLGVATLAWMALSERPAVSERLELSHQDIARAKRILRQNDPRYLRAGSRRQVRIGQQDLELAIHYLARTFGQIHTQIQLTEQHAVLIASRQLAAIPKRSYLNVRIELDETDGELQLRSLRVGDLSVPSWLARELLKIAIDKFASERQAQLLRATIQDLRLSPGEVQLSYVWNPALLDELGALVRPDEQAALRAYQSELVRISQSRPGRLTDILTSLFQVARQRSKTADPITENRAALTALAAWAAGRRLPLLNSQAQARPSRFAARLGGRSDLAQHYLISAALAAAGDTRLANAVGLHKEIADTEGRSGFSFSDLAADLAGSRLGQLATASTDSAIEIQVRLAAAPSERNLLPEVTDLPDNLSQSEFGRRYQSTESDVYKTLVKDIERRIDLCTLYQRPG